MCWINDIVYLYIQVVISFCLLLVYPLDRFASNFDLGNRLSPKTFFGKKAKIVIYDKARLNGGTYYDYLGFPSYCLYFESGTSGSVPTHFNFCRSESSMLAQSFWKICLNPVLFLSQLFRCKIKCKINTQDRFIRVFSSSKLVNMNYGSETKVFHFNYSCFLYYIYIKYNVTHLINFSELKGKQPSLKIFSLLVSPLWKGF